MNDTPETEKLWHDFCQSDNTTADAEKLKIALGKLERERNELLHAARECLLFPSNPATPKLRKVILSLENSELSQPKPE